MACPARGRSYAANERRDLCSSADWSSQRVYGILVTSRCLIVVNAQESKAHGSLSGLLDTGKPGLAHERENPILRVVNQTMAGVQPSG